MKIPYLDYSILINYQKDSKFDILFDKLTSLYQTLLTSMQNVAISTIEVELSVI